MSLFLLFLGCSAVNIGGSDEKRQNEPFSTSVGDSNVQNGQPKHPPHKGQPQGPPMGAQKPSLKAPVNYSWVGEVGDSPKSIILVSLDTVYAGRMEGWCRSFP